MVAGFILTEAALPYLGLGMQPPTASWGTMPNNSTRELHKSPELPLYPGITIAVTVLAVSIAGNGLRDGLDPRQHRCSVSNRERRAPPANASITKSPTREPLRDWVVREVVRELSAIASQVRTS